MNIIFGTGCGIHYYRGVYSVCLIIVASKYDLLVIKLTFMVKMCSLSVRFMSVCSHNVVDFKLYLLLFRDEVDL